MVGEGDAGTTLLQELGARDAATHGLRLHGAGERGRPETPGTDETPGTPKTPGTAGTDETDEVVALEAMAGLVEGPIRRAAPGVFAVTWRGPAEALEQAMAGLLPPGLTVRVEDLSPGEQQSGDQQSGDQDSGAATGGRTEGDSMADDSMIDDSMTSDNIESVSIADEVEPRGAREDPAADVLERIRALAERPVANVDFHVQREGLQRLSVALQSMLRRLDGAVDRLDAAAPAPAAADALAARLESRLDALAARLEQVAPDAEALTAQLDRIEAALAARPAPDDGAAMVRRMACLLLSVEESARRIAAERREAPAGADHAWADAAVDRCVDAMDAMTGAMAEFLARLERRDAAGDRP